MDPEQNAEDLVDLDEDPIPGQVEPKFLRPPDNDLLPDRIFSRRNSDVLGLQQWNSGMLPSELAKIRRRSSIHRPPINIYKPVNQTRSPTRSPTVLSIDVAPVQELITLSEDQEDEQHEVFTPVEEPTKSLEKNDEKCPAELHRLDSMVGMITHSFM